MMPGEKKIDVEVGNHENKDPEEEGPTKQT